MDSGPQLEAPTVASKCFASDCGERASLTRWADLPGAELLTADYRNHAYVPHWHDAFTVALVANGCTRISLAGTTHLVDAGKVVLLNPGEVHDGEAYDASVGWAFRVFYLDASALREAAEDMELRGGSPYNIRSNILEDKRSWDDLIALHAALVHSTCSLERTSRLFSGITSLLVKTTAMQVNRTLVTSAHGLDRARQYLHAHWAMAISLDTLASVAGLSRFHFLRSFSKRYGLTPHAYQLQLRILHAKEMIFQGLALSDVAVATGFHDQAHLTHTSRRFIGVPPGRIKQLG